MSMRLLTMFMAAALCLSSSGCSRSPFQTQSAPTPVFSHLGVSSSVRPVLAQAENGTLSLLAADPVSQRLLLTVSHDGGDNFMHPVFVSPEDTHAQFRGENGPSLAVRGMNTFALWQQSGEHGAVVVFARQSRMGEPFSQPVQVTDKPATDQSYNGFSSMALGPKGEVYAVWLDGREPLESKGTFGLYFAASFDQGATFGKNIRIASSVCPCCRPSIQVADDGAIFIPWRKVFPGDIRDIVIARSNDKGLTFSPPVRVAQDDWVLHACPDSGPSLQVRNGLISVAWFSEGGGKTGIRYSESRDQGNTFSPAELVSQKVADPNHPVLLDTADGRLLIFQGRAHSEDGFGSFGVYAVRVTGQSAPSNPFLIPGAVQAAYPSAVSSPGHAVVTWSTGHDEKSSVMMSRLRW